MPLLITNLLLGFGLLSPAHGAENPFLSAGAPVADGKLGAFKQNAGGDCFFLASLLAIAQDSKGQALIESAFRGNPQQRRWRIVFPNLPERAAEVSEQEQRSYRLLGSDSHRYSAPVWGDPDVASLEIAADKIWKKTIKAEGLWDDVPMNALFMFSGAEQMLIWKRGKAAVENIDDIDKYRRLPAGLVKEIQPSSPANAEMILKNIIAGDRDGISMVLIDYIRYHASAIVDLDFDSRTYRIIDPHSSVPATYDLNGLLDSLINGQYAVNYVEIRPTVP
nr:hypothetical protein [Methylomarinum sp. Ch1-1]MDP4519392.1 hypothetical protein [Methylomarinum sp. Ch1-1]